MAITDLSRLLPHITSLKFVLSEHTFQKTVCGHLFIQTEHKEAAITCARSKSILDCPEYQTPKTGSSPAPHSVLSQDLLSFTHSCASSRGWSLVGFPTLADVIHACPDPGKSPLGRWHKGPYLLGHTLWLLRLPLTMYHSVQFYSKNWGWSISLLLLSIQDSLKSLASICTQAFNLLEEGHLSSCHKTPQQTWEEDSSASWCSEAHWAKQMSVLCLPYMLKHLGNLLRFLWNNAAARKGVFLWYHLQTLENKALESRILLWFSTVHSCPA